MAETRGRPSHAKALAAVKNASGVMDFLGGGGEMGERIRAFDWRKTALGPPESWPQSLRSALSMLLPSKAQIVFFWGRDLITFYNDAYRPVFGAKHPRVLGLPAHEAWSELWFAGLKELFEGVLTTGEAYWASDRPFYIERFGYPEETFFDVSYDPVRDETGRVGGVFCIVNETTERVISARRLKTLRELGVRTMADAKSAEHACQSAAQILAANRYDLPFGLIYLLDGDAKLARLAGMAGLHENLPAAIHCVDMTESAGAAWPLREVMETGHAEVVADLSWRLGAPPSSVWPEPPQTAVVLPIGQSGQDRPAGFLVAGVNPRRPLDDQHRGFFDLLANQLGTAIANARTYEEERKRAEALAEIDRAKTVFFSNVSHEFRTPLTLMLGPVQDFLSSPQNEVGAKNRELLNMVQRNGLRLQKLVNTLLDFSRIEAGRIQTVYEPTDLAALTAELASSFRSACEKAGLALSVRCDTLAESIYVDREMWEKIVLNLIANAFKYTLAGEIEVSLRQVGAWAELAVRDTGIGISEYEISNIFKRFYRIEAARGRTHEGTGIGLSLVQELVKFHGGNIGVQSVYGAGSTFTVRIPLGNAHLPPDRIRATAPRALASTAIGANAYVEEAIRWLPGAGVTDGAEADLLGAEQAGLGSHHRALNSQLSRVLIADDNADMRDYLRRLLAQQNYRVESVADGQAALAAARREKPDLMIIDVMMPIMDGFALLRAVREDEELKTIPVIMLSARAGEEAKVEGLNAGADDYLIKPFSARELLAHVGAHLAMARVRKEAAEKIRLSEAELRDFVENANVGLHRVNSDGIILWANQTELDLLGYTREEYVGHSIADFHVDVAMIEAILARLSRGERVVSCETAMRCKDGSIRHVLINASALFEDGKFIHTRCFTRDITERKRAEQMDARLRSIIDSSDDAIISKDLNGVITSWNPGAEQLFGYNAAEAIGQPVSILIPPERLDEEPDILKRIRRGERIQHYETVRRRKDGRLLNISLSISPLRDENGRVVGASKIARDITDRKEAENVLLTLAAIVESSDDAIISEDLNGAITSWNYAAERLFGYTAEEAVGKPVNILIPAERLDEEPAILERIRRGERIEHYETVRRRKDGALLNISLSVSPIIDAEGRVVGASKIARDITQRKLADEKLRQSEQRFRMMADSSPVMIWITNAKGETSFLNRNYLEYSGVRADEAPTFDWSEITHPEDRDAYREAFKTALRERRMFHHRVRLRRHDGQWRWFESRGNPILDDAGNMIAFIGSASDITEIYESQQALKELGQRKDEFLANMSHEIRSPLTGIMGYADILLSKLRDPEDIEYLNTIKESGNYLIEIVSDILDLAKIEAGKLVLNIEEVSVHAVLVEVQSLMDVRAKQKRLPVVLRYEGVLPVTIQTDRTRLRQILINLVSNAIKFTERGRVEIVARFLEDDGLPTKRGTRASQPGGHRRTGASAFQVEVIDTGMGIAPEHQAILFQPFTQADSRSTREYGGTGLGLTITKRLVEMLGGHISFESALGQGSAFRITVPTGTVGPIGAHKSEPLDAAASKPIDSPLRDHRVLVVDDREEICYLVSRYVKDAGAQPTSVSSGPAAIKAIQAAQETEPFDAMILDIQMPNMDGFDVARTLRAKGFRTPIIALTAAAMVGDREKCLQAGCDDYLTKPIDRNALVRLIAQHVHKANGAATPGKLRVLLVDDSHNACKFLTLFLEKRGYEVRSAYDGESAIVTARDFRPGVILVDIRLPDMDGFQLLKQFKELDCVRGSRFIGLSGYRDRENQRVNEFDHFLEKPLDTAHLETLLRAIAD
jgi:PAS domain S-box-containing protein